jgi:hypothetical protein
MKFLKLDVLWKIPSARADNNKVLKNSVLGQILSDFEKISLKMSGKA